MLRGLTSSTRLTAGIPGLEIVTALGADKRLARHHRLLAVQAHLRELDGDTKAAAADYLAAAGRTTSLPERRYLALQAARLTGGELRSVTDYGDVT